MTHPKCTLALLLALAVQLLAAPTALALRSDQIEFSSIDGVQGTDAESNTRAVLNRLPTIVPEFSKVIAFITCIGDTVDVLGIIDNPHKVLDLKNKIQLEQKQDVIIVIDDFLADGAAPSCKAKLSFLDKDKDGDVEDGNDQAKWSLQCKDLATDLGLDAGQTAILEADFGEKLQCKGKGVPEEACFRGDTPIATEHGQRPIRDVRVGDRVWSWDEETKQNVLRRVTRTYVKSATGLRSVRIDGETLYTTDEHPYWVEGKGWTDAMLLTRSDRLRTMAGGELAVLDNDRVTPERFYTAYDASADRRAAAEMDMVQAFKLRRAATRGVDAPTPELVFNLEVEDTHTFFVGTQRVLVHNK